MKKINVLLSSYNGERYIGEQIESVMKQQDVLTFLTIRDDGSKDETVKIIREKQKKYSQRINLYLGENVGYRKSFLKLLSLTEEADYYAFSDQDDFWLPDKCIRAIKKLGKINDNICLYASGVILTDEKLNIKGKTDSWKMPQTIESYFTRQRLAGCTYIFSHALKELANRFSAIDYKDKEMPDHDFVVGSCAFACGTVCLDKESYILHRRHDCTVTSGGSGILKRLQVEYDLTFKRVRVQAVMAQLLIEKCGSELKNKEINIFLNMIAENSGVKRKLKLLKNKNMTTGILICDLENKLKILLGTY